MATLSKKELDFVVKMARDNFYFFVQMIMPPKWYDAVFHRKLCDFLQYGGNYKVIILARTHLKTTICSTFYPLWLSTRNSSMRTLLVSNTSTNAEKTVRSIRTIIESNSSYQNVFPELIPNFQKVRWSDKFACLKRKEDYPEATFESAGVGSNIIRRHFNIVIEDDTVAPKKDDFTGEECMPSREDIEQAVGFHRLIPPLLIGEDFDEQIVVGTRWADYDHLSWIQKNEKKYNIFDVPAEDDNGVPTYKRFSRERLDSIRVSMGTSLYSALYLNKPLSKESMTFNPDWIRYYEEDELPKDGVTVVTVDPADPPTGKSNQDYSAILSARHCKTGIYFRRYTRERLTDKGVIAKALSIAKQDGATKIRIEADRYAHLKYGFKEQMALNAEQARVDGKSIDGEYFSIEEVKTKGRNKNARIRQRLQPLYENGVIYHKRGMRELEAELAAFPNGVHDDVIDAAAWQIEGIHATNRTPIVPKKRRNPLPTIDEMIASIPTKNRRSNYPFDVQVGSNKKVNSLFEFTDFKQLN